MYPSPHHDLLRAHYQTSVLSAAAEPLDNDDNEDESWGTPGNSIRLLGIWLDGSNQYELHKGTKLVNHQGDLNSIGSSRF